MSCMIQSRKNVVEPEGPDMTSQYGAYAFHAGKARQHARAFANATQCYVINKLSLLSETAYVRNTFSRCEPVNSANHVCMLHHHETAHRRTTYTDSSRRVILSILSPSMVATFYCVRTWLALFHNVAVASASRLSRDRCCMTLRIPRENLNGMWQ